jgi:hypothetical protein
MTYSNIFLLFQKKTCSRRRPFLWLGEGHFPRQVDLPWVPWWTEQQQQEQGVEVQRTSSWWFCRFVELVTLKELWAVVFVWFAFLGVCFRVWCHIRYLLTNNIQFERRCFARADLRKITSGRPNGPIMLLVVHALLWGVTKFQLFIQNQRKILNTRIRGREESVQPIVSYALLCNVYWSTLGRSLPTGYKDEITVLGS